MAVKYVKDFSFPADRGFTGSTGKITSVKPHTRVKLAQGGKVTKPSAPRTPPLGSGLASKARESLLGRKGRVDAYVEASQGRAKKAQGGKVSKAPSKGDSMVGALKRATTSPGIETMKPPSRAMEQALRERDERKMDKNMAEGYENYKRLKAGKGTLADPIYPQDKLGGLKGTIGRRIFGSKVVTDSEKARYKAAIALNRRKAARGEK